MCSRMFNFKKCQNCTSFNLEQNSGKNALHVFQSKILVLSNQHHQEFELAHL